MEKKKNIEQFDKELLQIIKCNSKHYYLLKKKYDPNSKFLSLYQKINKNKN